MKQVKILYNGLSVGFFNLNESQEILGHGFHVDEVSIIDDIKNQFPTGTKIILDDNYFRISK
jgi:hypothetical protein